MESNSPLVSIVIPTANSANHLQKCLQSVKNQTYKSLEIIVIDKFSNDETPTMVHDFGCVFHQLDSNQNAAKNYGLKLAKGEFILFLDSDQELSDSIIEECINLYKKIEKIGGISIPERSIGDSFWVKVRDFERSFYGNTLIESPRFFKKDSVLSVNGFDETSWFWDESTLRYKIEKLGLKTDARITSYIYHHEENFKLLKWLKKRSKWATQHEYYERVYSDYATKQMSPIYRLSIFLSKENRKRFLCNLLLASAVILLKTMELIATNMGKKQKPKIVAKVN